MRGIVASGLREESRVIEGSEVEYTFRGVNGVQTTARTLPGTTVSDVLSFSANIAIVDTVDSLTYSFVSTSGYPPNRKLSWWVMNQRA